MACCERVRYHESGHAVAALILGVSLKPEGIDCSSDHDACTHVQEKPDSEWTEEYCTDRAAVKLSGPAAECRLRCQEFSPDTLQNDPQYVRDYGQAQQIFQRFQTYHGQPDPALIVERVCTAMYRAYNVIACNWPAVEAVARALDGRNGLSAEGIRCSLNARS
jgi:hypothetical protein